MFNKLSNFCHCLALRVALAYFLRNLSALFQGCARKACKPPNRWYRLYGFCTESGLSHIQRLAFYSLSSSGWKASPFCESAAWVRGTGWNRLESNLILRSSWMVFHENREERHCEPLQSLRKPVSRSRLSEHLQALFLERALLRANPAVCHLEGTSMSSNSISSFLINIHWNRPFTQTFFFAPPDASPNCESQCAQRTPIPSHVLCYYSTHSENETTSWRLELCSSW